ncbi:MAG: PEGA domain-containing protein [Treponema sp.]|nr:PEGA domain-containing protein [Treponema sp.]
MKNFLKPLACFLVLFFSLASVFAQDFIEPLDYSVIEELESGAEVRIESNVPKTEIYLNGIFYGKTNLNVKDLIPGEYLLTVKKKGYKDSSYVIEVRRNYRLTYKLKLEKS